MQAICRLTACQQYDLPADSISSAIYHYLIKKFPAGAGLPDPDLIIAAGHGTHLSMLCARHARAGKAIVLMKPSLPAALFDLCFIPSHDKPGSAKNIVQTQGALNTSLPSSQLNAARGLVMIGGESKHYSWDNTSLTAQIKEVLNTPNIQWHITDSPRTPDISRRSMHKLASDNVQYIPFNQAPAAWLHDALQQAGTVWVSEDSISMIYEAITSGASVGVFNVPIKNPGRISSAVKKMLDDKLITAFHRWKSGTPLSPAKPPLNEAARCAQLLLNRLCLPKHNSTRRDLPCN